MTRILVAACEQEISTFNPVPTEFADFEIFEGEAVLERIRGSDTTMRGAVDVFGMRSDLEIVPAIAAKCRSGGSLSDAGFKRLAATVLDAIRSRIDGIDAIYFSLHGAMGAETQLDPEGYLLEVVRGMVGPRIPIVISLDLHGILTARMLQNCDGIAVYHTYPHHDFIDTGERAARFLLRILDDGVRPVMARVKIPALVRGPELITA
ncbi:MAG: M81 family metallopeptidase, partial [Pseudomonadota bacterium]